MSRHIFIKRLATLVPVMLPLAWTYTALADSGDIGPIESFIKSVITVVASLAGLIAAGFIMVGGLSYITSTGNPEKLQHAKHTIVYSSLGLAITIGAFVLTSIVTNLATSAFGK